jgi:hypothetical protein
MAVGAAAAAYLLGLAAPITIAGGAAVGTAGGVLLHLVTRPLEQKAPSKMVHELRRGD